MLKTATLLFALVFCSQAFGLEHRTGLKVELPDTFVVTQVRPLRIFEAVIGIKLASGETFGTTVPNLCEATFDAQPGWIAFRQSRFNDKLSAPTFPRDYARQVSSIFSVLRSERFETRGIVGYEFVMVPHSNPALVTVTSVMETPAGKTALTCLTARQLLPRAISVFRTILTGVTPPAGGISR